MTAWIRTAAIALFLLALLNVAHAASSASITLRGVVKAVEQIQVIPQPGHDELNLTDGGDFLVAVVNEKSNSRGGYTVTLTSQNAPSGTSRSSFLTGHADGSKPIAYSIKYGVPGLETPVSLKNGTALLTTSNVRTSGDGTSKVLRVDIPKGTPRADTYQDILVLTLAKN
jgi:hypothetical protein